MKLCIASDYTGDEMRIAVTDYVRSLGHEVTDITRADIREEYPLIGERAGRAVAAGEYDLGILICGTGIGISLAANRVKGIRAAVVSEPYSAKMSRTHNNANIIAFGSRVVGVEMSKMIVDAFLSSSFEGGRHEERIALLEGIDRN
ncbi:MAG: ribose 5-phosphate isomerase B [Christensenellales bacterium]|jgi:ribose 5-phosphate isomerase B